MSIRTTKSRKAYKLAQAQRIWSDVGHLVNGYTLVDGHVTEGK